MWYNMLVARKCGTNRGIAQLVEYRSPKPWVAGSNPPAPAIEQALTFEPVTFGPKVRACSFP